MTADEKKVLNQTYEGYEWCSYCGEDVAFKITPIKGIKVICGNCGHRLTVCSLCAQPDGCGGNVNCRKSVLDRYEKMQAVLGKGEDSGTSQREVMNRLIRIIAEKVEEE
jgi:hypothetical protein